MSGQQHSHKPQSGKQILSLAILLLVICSILLGCTDRVASILPGPGRADWELPLFEQYYLIKGNNSSIKICKATDVSGLYENVLTYFYVTKYSVFEPFICLEGIPTDGLFVAEDELASDNRQYYLLDVRDENLYGPYDTEESLIKSDLAKGIDVSLVWETVPQ